MQNQLNAVNNHSLALVQGVIADLERAGLKFDDMQAAITSAPAMSDLTGSFGNGTPIQYLGSNNEIAATPSALGGLDIAPSRTTGTM